MLKLPLVLRDIKQVKSQSVMSFFNQITKTVTSKLRLFITSLSEFLKLSTNL